MALIDRPIPGLFGGLSQQIPAMRHPTQCDEQLNMYATVVDGLMTRPGTRHIRSLDQTGTNGASVAGSGGVAAMHVIDSGGANRYLLLVKSGSLMVYNLFTGAAEPISFPNGKAYLNASFPTTAFRFLTQADYTFLVNTELTPFLNSSLEPANDSRVCFINVRVASPGAVYKITVNGAVAVFAAPGTGVLTQGMVVDGLVTALAAVLPSVFSITVLPDTNVIKVFRSDGPIIGCSSSDTWGNTGTQVVSNGVPKYEDLPARFEPGYVVTVNATPESSTDGYYVRWDGDKWVETKQPGLNSDFNIAQMPHQLYRVGGAWVFGQIPSWGARLVGNEKTNPTPSFIGTPIRDIFFFRNRLGFLAGDSVVLSKAGRYFDFWADTAVQVLDTDPIDLSAPSEQTPQLAWAVPFNQNLLVWGTGKQQFVLTSGDILSPKNARLVPSSTFDVDPLTRPAALGNKAVFAEGSGDWAKLGLYKVSVDTVTNDSDPITDHVPRLLKPSPRQLATSTFMKAIMAVPSEAGNEFHHFKYETDSAKDILTQRAWSRFRHATTESIRFIGGYWVGTELYLVVYYQSGDQFALEVMDFQTELQDFQVDTVLAMDRRCVLTGGVFDGTSTTYTVPYWDDTALLFFRCQAGKEPYPCQVLSKIKQTGYISTVSLKGNLTTSTVWCGIPLPYSYVFTEFFLRDGDNIPVQSVGLKVVRLLLRYVKSARFYAKVTPKLRDTYSYPFGGREVGAGAAVLGALALSSGDASVPVGCNAEGTRVAIEGTSHLPIKLPYASWVADVRVKAQR